MAAQRIDLGQDAQFVLDVVGDLVGNHIGGGEIPACSHALRQKIKELRVDIGLFIRRAVERPRRARGPATGTLRDVGKDNELGRHVFTAQLLCENLAPDIFGGGQHPRGELRGLLVRVRDRRALLGLRRAAPVQQGRYVDAGEIADRQHRQNADDPQTARTPGTAPAPAAADLNVFASSDAAQPHKSVPVMSNIIVSVTRDAHNSSMNKSNDLAENRTDWAEDRTILANERTFAGWMRTGMASLAVAIGLKAVFGDFDPTWAAKSVATIFVVAAVYIFWAAHDAATKTLDRLNDHHANAQPNARMKTLAVIFSFASVAVGGILWML